MIKAIVTVERKETYYDMEYIKVERYTYTAETKMWLMNNIYRDLYHGYETIKVEIVEG